MKPGHNGGGNPYHDNKTGQFTSAEGGSSAGKKDSGEEKAAMNLFGLKGSEKKNKYYPSTLDGDILDEEGIEASSEEEAYKIAEQKYPGLGDELSVSADEQEADSPEQKSNEKIYTDSHGVQWKKNPDKGDGKNYGYSRVDAPNIISNIPADTGATPEEGWNSVDNTQKTNDELLDGEEQQAMNLFGLKGSENKNSGNSIENYASKVGWKFDPNNSNMDAEHYIIERSLNNLIDSANKFNSGIANFTKDDVDETWLKQFEYQLQEDNVPEELIEKISKTFYDEAINKKNGQDNLNKESKDLISPIPNSKQESEEKQQLNNNSSNIDNNPKDLLHELSKRQSLKLYRNNNSIMIRTKNNGDFWLTRNKDGTFNLENIFDMPIKKNVSADEILKIFPSGNQDYSEKTMSDIASHIKVPDNWDNMSYDEKAKWMDIAAKYSDINVFDDSEFDKIDKDRLERGK